MKTFYNLNILGKGKYYIFEIVSISDEHAPYTILTSGKRYYSYIEACQAATQEMVYFGIDDNKYKEYDKWG